MSQKHRESKNHHYSNHNYKERQQELDELADVRIITKNLVYIIGLSSSIASKEKLIKHKYLGQYGTIIKIVVNKNKAYNQNSPHGPSYSAYVTFSKPSEASIAILSLDDTMIDNHLIRASFGTTKYCSYFLKGIECNNKECLFLHKLADENDIIKRGDLTSNKIIFAQQHAYAMKIADIYNPEVKKRILASKKGKTVFPSPDLIYRFITVIDKDPNNHKNMSNNKKSVDNKKQTNNSENIEDDYMSNEEEYEEKNEEYEENEEHEDNISQSSGKVGNYKNNNNSSNVVPKPQQQVIKRKKLFINRDKSRFDFGASSKNSEENNKNGIITVPKHILNLINKKINLYNLTKYMHQKIIDKIFLSESIKDDKEGKNDDWTKFINDNIEVTNYSNYSNNSNDEFVNDIDNINHFILNKVSSQALQTNK